MLHFFLGLDLGFIAFLLLAVLAELEQQNAMNYEVYYRSPHRWMDGDHVCAKELAGFALNRRVACMFVLGAWSEISLWGRGSKL